MCRTHLEAALGARPSGRFGVSYPRLVRRFANDEAVQTPRSRRYLFEGSVSMPLPKTPFWFRRFTKSDVA